MSDDTAVGFGFSVGFVVVVVQVCPWSIDVKTRFRGFYFKIMMQGCKSLAFNGVVSELWALIQHINPLWQTVGVVFVLQPSCDILYTSVTLVFAVETARVKEEDDWPNTHTRSLTANPPGSDMTEQKC